MIEINFPKLTGSITPVPIGAYEEIVQGYVDKVRSIPGVRGIVQIGSVSVPGLSDIDLIVTIADKGPSPSWEEISLRRFVENHPHKEVVSHDIFVVPESIARNMDAFFFVNQQKILMGHKLGSDLRDDEFELYQKMFAIEYSFHRLESLFGMLLQPEVSLRAAVLLISTVRHSLSLAKKVRVIGNENAGTIRKETDKIRQKAVEGNLRQQELDKWPARILDMLWTIVSSLGQDITDGAVGKLPQTWHTSSRTGIVDSFDDSGIGSWKLCLGENSKNTLRKRIRVFTAPVGFHRHVAAYLAGDSETSKYLRKHFPRIGALRDPDPQRRQARNKRAELVCNHWQFIRETGYLNSSGKGYIGLSMPAHGRWQDLVLAGLRSLQTTRMARNLLKDYR